MHDTAAATASVYTRQIRGLRRQVLLFYVFQRNSFLNEPLETKKHKTRLFENDGHSLSISTR